MCKQGRYDFRCDNRSICISPLQINYANRKQKRLTSFFPPMPVVIVIGAVRSMSASISEMSSVENPFVIVVSPVFEVLNCPVTFPFSLLSSFVLLRRLIKSHRTVMMSKQRMTPDDAEMINSK